jgi:phage-related protein
MSVFTWLASYGTRKDTKPKLRKAQFGDGYAQRSAMGINNIGQTWQVALNNRSQTDKDAVEAFLRTVADGTSFDWTPPGEASAIKVTCGEWGITPVDFGAFTINAVFEQVYGE